MDQSQFGSLMCPQTHLDHDQQIAQENVDNTEINSLTNNNNVDPDNITIRIIGVTDDENNINNSDTQDNNNPIKDRDYRFADTAEDIKQKGWTPKMTTSGQQE